MSKQFLIVSLMAICVLVLTACASPTSPPAPATSAPTPVPPTITPAALGSEAAEFPKLGNGEPAGDEEPAGFYKPPAAFSFPFTFKTDKVYRGIYEQFSQAQIFGIAQGSAMQPPDLLLFWAVDPSYSVDQVISELRATQNMKNTENQAVQVAGVSGTQFDATADSPLAIPALGKFVGHAGSDWRTDSPKVHLRFIALPISGRSLLIYIEAPQDEWDSFLADANQVLSTVKFAANTP